VSLFLQMKPFFFIFAVAFGFFSSTFSVARELACEVGFPVSEAPTNALMYSITSLIDFFVLSGLGLIVDGKSKTDSIIGGTTIFGLAVASIVSSLFIEEKLGRLEADKKAAFSTE